ncbi:MAG: GIY-YIG nuclease family protein [Saprospiraceae bacterium]|nr:GIY-YIG nuclease family protein [Saprospiraceae bacterium]
MEVLTEYIVYVLKSEMDGRLYVGFTENLDRRIKEHESGTTKSTKGFRPWKLVHQETVLGLQQARDREKYLKSGVGKEWLKAIVKMVP